MITTTEAVVHAANYQSHHVDARLRTIDELVRIAAAGRAQGAPVTFKDLGERTLSDMLKLIAAGGRWEGRVVMITASGCQAPAQHRVCAADALLPGFLLSRFLCLPASTASAPRAEW